MGDINKITITGTAITYPAVTHLSSDTTIAFFTLKVKETWLDRSKQHKLSRDNNIKVEALSRNAEWVKQNVTVGKRLYIDGYLRTDTINGVDETKIRVFHIVEEDNQLFSEGLKSGLIKALSILHDNPHDKSIELIEGTLSSL